MTTQNRERRPRGSEWHEVFIPGDASDVADIAASAWVSGPLRVISALSMAELPDGSGEVGPQWHISITRKGKRPKPTDVRRALRAFGMVGTEEDNHHPGNARHFWLPVDPARRVECECKATEVNVTDADGYRWTNEPAPELCRGCELEGLIGKPCPLHTEARAYG